MNPVVLIGLDGATYDVLDPLITDGAMPCLANLIFSGQRRTLASTSHPLSPPAWASIITGREPGEHGIFDFVRVDHSSGNPAYTLISSADLRAPSIFEQADRSGFTVTALNFPAMFPPPDVRGSVIPGYVPASYLARACRPRQLHPELVAAGVQMNRLAVDWELERTAVQGLASDELLRWVELHIEREAEWAEITVQLMRNRPADLTAVVFDGVDRIQHLCLHLLRAGSGDLTPAERRTRARCVDYFRLVDRILARISAAAADDSTMIIVSDHGARQAGSRIFYANTWLERQGLLRWADDTPVDRASRLALNGNSESGTLFDWSHTSAAALTSSSNAIIVHRADAPGGPGVTPEEYPQFCRRLADELLAARDPETGEPIVDRVLFGPETFPGRYAGEAPDLTLVLHQPGFLSVLRGPAITAARSGPYGTHHPDGILVATGPGIADTVLADDGRSLSVTDVAPAVLQLLGAAEPATVPAAARGRTSAPAFDADGEAEIIERLRRLGYLD